MSVSSQGQLLRTSNGTIASIAKSYKSLRRISLTDDEPLVPRGRHDSELSCSRMSSQYSLTLPTYLDPQPKYFVDHMKEDMVIETFDPLEDTEEEEEVVQVVFEDEYDEDFDYESLYPDERVVGEDDESQNQLLIEELQQQKRLTTLPVRGSAAVDQVDLKSCADDDSKDSAVDEIYAKAASHLIEKRRSSLNKAEAPNILKKNFEEYFLDRQENKIEKLNVGYDSWWFSEGCEILHRKRQIACLDSILVKERDKYKQLKGAYNLRWLASQDKLVGIDNSLEKFNSYYKDSLTKRNRAIRQTSLEKAQKEEKDQEIRKYRKELDCLKRLQSEWQTRLDRFKIFERYLDMVKQESKGEFSDTRDIIDRYGVLAQARGGLMDRELKNHEKTERARFLLNRVMNLENNELLVYNNYLSELQVFRDALQEDILQLEEQLLHIKSTAANRTLLIGQIKLATNNLYQGLCKQLKRSCKIPPDDAFRQLQYIKGSMKEIIKLSKDVKQMLKAAAIVAQREAAAKAQMEAEQRKKQRFAVMMKDGVENLAQLFGFS